MSISYLQYIRPQNAFSTNSDAMLTDAKQSVTVPGGM